LSSHKFLHNNGDHYGSEYCNLHIFKQQLDHDMWVPITMAWRMLIIYWPSSHRGQTWGWYSCFRLGDRL